MCAAGSMPQSVSEVRIELRVRHKVAAAATTPTSSSFVPAEAGRTGTDLAKLFSNPRLLLLLGSDPSLLLQAPSLSLQTLALEPRFELGNQLLPQTGAQQPRSNEEDLFWE